MNNLPAFSTCLRACIVLPLAALLLLPAGPARADAAQREIHQLLDAFLAGASVNDAAMHDRFWSEDLVYTSSSGERRGKPEIMRSLAAATPAEVEALPRYSGEDVAIRTLGEVAVATFRLVAEMPDGSTREYFNTGVFRHEPGGWRAFTWQATRIPDGGGGKAMRVRG